MFSSNFVKDLTTLFPKNNANKRPEKPNETGRKSFLFCGYSLIIIIK